MHKIANITIFTILGVALFSTGILNESVSGLPNAALAGRDMKDKVI